MSDNLTDALLISLFGMGIVFGIILLTWGIMAVLTRIPPGKDEEGSVEQARRAETEPTPERTPDAERAAAAAVAVALALEREALTARPQPREEPAISAWQSVMRGRQLKQSFRRPSR